MNRLRTFCALLRKDLLIELRGRETLALLLGLSLLLGVITAFGANSAFLDPAQVHKAFPAFLWLVFVFAATVSIGRSYEFELEHMGIEGLIISGVPASFIFLAKLVANFAVILLGHLLLVTMLSVLLGVVLTPVASELVMLSALVVLAYTALSTLLIAMASTSRLKSMLLPLILLPLLFPVLFAALESTAYLLARGELDYRSFWFTLLVSLDVLYIVAGCASYEFVLRE